jgi:hemerythrin
MAKKETVVWSEDLACGIGIVDEQHKGLLALVNDLFEHSGGEPEEEREYLRGVIEKAANYVREHFSTEEGIMKRAGHEGYEDHRKAHENFISVALDKARVMQGGGTMNLAEYARFLRDWVVTHVANTDKRCFSAITASGTAY